MARTRVVSVIGYKNSGKTRVVESLVRELSSRGHQVGTLKHSAEDVLLDTPGKDTWRHREAGSRATAIMHDRSAAVFFDRFLTVREAVDRLGRLDYVVIEGLKTLETTPKIIVPRNRGDLESLTDGLEVAIARMPDVDIAEVGGVPVIPIDSPGRLADVVQTAFRNVVMGFVRSLKGVGEPSRVELSFEVEDDG
jgi:molybdopterin-guanine dinucleotide biosynthesis protein B